MPHISMENGMTLRCETSDDAVRQLTTLRWIAISHCSVDVRTWIFLYQLANNNKTRRNVRGSDFFGSQFIVRACIWMCWSARIWRSFFLSFSLSGPCLRTPISSMCQSTHCTEIKLNEYTCSSCSEYIAMRSTTNCCLYSESGGFVAIHSRTCT